MIKHFSKAIALILAFILIMGCFAGCKEEKEKVDNSSEDVNVSVTSSSDTDSKEDNSSDKQSDTSSKDESSSTQSDTSSKVDSTVSKTPSKPNNTEKFDDNLDGRVITFMTIWEEPAKGSSSFWNTYWKVKTTLQKKHNFTFKHVYGTGNWYDTWVASVMSGNPTADIICCQEDPYSSIKTGLFYDLKSLKQFNFSDAKWIKAINEMGTVDSKQYIMCAAKYSAESVVMYNKDMFKANGVEDLYTLQKKGKLTLDKFIKIATTLHSKTGKASILPGINVFNVHKHFAWAYGGKLMSRTSTKGISLKATINSTAVKNGFESAQALVNRGIVESNIDTKNWMWSREQFAKGNYPILIQGNLQSALENANFEVGAVRMPSVNGKPVTTTDNFQWCAIPYNVKKPEEVAFVFNQMADVIFTCDYKTRFQDIATDDIMEMINKQANEQQKGSGLSYDYSCIFGKDIWNNGIGNAMRDMQTGTATPAQTILTVENLYKSLITNKFGK